MPHRRCFSFITRHAYALISAKPSLSTLNRPSLPNPPTIKSISSIPDHISPTLWSNWLHHRHFSSRTPQGSDYDTDINDEDEDGDDTEMDDEEDDCEGESGTGLNLKREYSVEEKEAEAAAIGYKVIGPLERSDRVFKLYEPAFAVVQIGSHQFKVSNGDCIFTERLKFCEVNDKLILNKVLLVGSSTQTIIGRPVVPDAAVHAVVEEHALDAKVIIFKKKRRKNYRRTKGHRQELTKLRITDVQGIEKPDTIVDIKPLKAAVMKPQTAEVAA